MLVRIITLVAATALTFAAPAAQAQVDVIRGRVVDPTGEPIVNATVTATSLATAVSRSARTDRNGRYTITFPGGDGDYFVHFAAVGFAPRSYQLKRIADEEVLVADAQLDASPIMLDPIRVRAERQVVDRDDRPPDISGTEQPITPAALPPADLGDLAAMAATLPGVSLVPGADGAPDGFSVMGLGADQNNITLNGMAFGGTNLPRDATIGSGLVTSPYDVSRGGFSGGQISLNTRPGSNFLTRGLSLNLDAPQLQWTDRAARALGQEYTSASLGGLLSGPITLNRAFYNVAYQLDRRGSDFQSLLNTDPVGLQAAGVSPESRDRFLDAVGAHGIPLWTGGRAPRTTTGDRAMVFGSVDFAPPSSRTGQAFNLAFSGNWNRQDPVGGAATTLPASAGERSGWNAGIQGRHSAYFGFGILSETSIGVSGSRQESTPFLDLPAGRARVSSVFDDGTTGVQVLTFGGTSFPATRRSTTTTAAMNSLSWFSADNRHRLRLASEIRHDRYTSEQAGNVLGTFTFNSLEDLEANQPASFTRTLSPRESGAGRLAGALSLGDAWRVSDRIQLQLGVRLDGNRYLDRPDHNEEVEQLFGRRNDHVPSGVFVSPRVGFSWSYGRAAEVAGFAGAARAPRATVRGGIGVFQNVPGANLIGPALDQTGLPGAVQQITCVGPAVPVPDWPAYAASPENIPRVCADGSTGTVFADAAPNVSLFAPDFRPARSVRSNLQWSGAILDNRFVATVDATWSRNVDQTSTVDLNFDPTERFALADEGGRPVYVAPSSIVPATGTPAWRDARVASEFSRVTEVRSDLTSETRQLSLRLSPAQFRSGFSWSVAYVLGEMRQQVRGFDNTAGNPFDTEWTAGPMPRHHLVYSLGRNVFDVARLNWFGQFRSGTRFTPMVAGDINGDGYANDRAFVFDPATAADPDLAAAMQSLLDNGSSAARRCLERQLGHLARRNSCTGPWTSSANLGVVFNPARVRMPQRATLSLNLSNPLGAADLLLNGSSGLRGWGQPIAPDPVLLYVRGFDPFTQRYAYEVNPRFGSTSPATSVFRVPVTLTAMLRFDVGPFRERQSLERQLDRGRRNDAPRLPESIFRTIYGPNVVPNPLAQILRQQDSLALTSVQADSIATLNHWYLVRVDSLWAPVTKRLAELPDEYDTGAAWRQYLWARRATIDMLAQIGPHVRELLTSDQLRRLPPIVAAHLDPRYLATIRSGTGTFAAAGAMPMPAQSAAGVGRMTGDGGGVRATRGP